MLVTEETNPNFNPMGTVEIFINLYIYKFVNLFLNFSINKINL